MRVNGKTYRVAPSTDAIGYEMRPGRRPRRLSDAQRPGLLVVSASAPASSSPGTEVLAGIIRDANGPWLSERLRERGVHLAHVHVVGDRPDDLRAGLELPCRDGWT